MSLLKEKLERAQKLLLDERGTAELKQQIIVLEIHSAMIDDREYPEASDFVDLSPEMLQTLVASWSTITLQMLAAKG